MSRAAAGRVCCGAALVDALRGVHRTGAGVCVFEVEPLAMDLPLREMDNVFLSPHFAGTTIESRARLFEMIGENLCRVLDGDPPLNVVNQVQERVR